MREAANAVLARVRAMYGHRLSANDYANLLSSSSISEIANYLKSRTIYGDIFAPNAGTQITAESIEFCLHKELSSRLQKLCSFERMIHDPFYDYFILKSDLYLITAAARTLVSTSALASSYMPSDFFSERSALDMNKLYNATSAAELISALSHTRYYSVAKRFIGADGMFDFSMVEVHLLRFYAETAKKMAKRFDKKSTKELYELIDLEIDCFNIANIYRSKKNGTQRELILAKLIFEHGTITKSKLMALLNAQTDIEFVDVISKTKPGKGFETADLIYPEAVYDANLYRIHKRYLRFSSNPDIVVLAYMHLMENEIRNITHIVEGKRYEMSAEQIQKFLIGID